MKCPLCVRDGSGKGGNIELWKYKIPLNGNKKIILVEGIFSFDCK